MAEQGRSFQDILRAFMEDGGRTIGGVFMGNPDLGLGIRFEPNVKTPAW